VLNVSFYYPVHAQTHDHDRYIRFALGRFAALCRRQWAAAVSGLQMLRLAIVGGLVEILTDLVTKALSTLPLLGHPLAVGLHGLGLAFVRTSLGARSAKRSGWHFPLGCFMVVERSARALP